MSAETLRKILAENMERAFNNEPPVFPCVITTIIDRYKITAENEHEVLLAAIRIRQELYAAYQKATDVFSRPFFNISFLKEVDGVTKNSWEVIVREMRRIGGN